MAEEGEQAGLVAYAKDTIRKPIDIATSKPARRAYLTTFLLIATATTLLGIATTAYALFYWNYIPQIGFERTIHLQFDNVYRSDDTRYDSAANPHGTVNLGPDIVSAQRYDVSIELSLPRTPQNQEAGNFMLEATMYAGESMVDPVKDALLPGAANADNLLARSRRTAILAYRSPIVDKLYKLTELHWYLLGWRREAETLKVSVFESVEFARGWRNVPSTMTVQVQSTNRMQIYSAKAVFRARFSGLRWLMYNHRIISAVVFVTAFWITELVFAGLMWMLATGYLSSRGNVKVEVHDDSSEKVKSEREDDEQDVLSDTERTFPTSSRQQPLRYESPRVKSEEDDEPVVLPETISRATEADDEDDDEDADVFFDSGIGTSMESSATHRDSVRKRRGRAGSGDGGK